MRLAYSPSTIHHSPSRPLVSHESLTILAYTPLIRAIAPMRPLRQMPECGTAPLCRERLG